MNVVRTAGKYSQRFQNLERAERYAQRFERGSRLRIDRREQRAVARTFALIPKCRTVLDIPSGAGRFFGTLSHGGRRVIEMDVAHEMLVFAREKAVKLPSGAGASSKTPPPAPGLAQADATRIPLQDGAVDCVFSNRLLHHIVLASERAVILREFHRVTSRYAVISFFNYKGLARVRTFFKRLRGRRPAYDEQPSLDAFRDEVIRAGFRVQAVVPTGLPWASQKYFLLEKA
jgi:ubiquinone/menaquinone biosynthesis C-methylase UbiE